MTQHSKHLPPMKHHSRAFSLLKCLAACVAVVVAAAVIVNTGNSTFHRRGPPWRKAIIALEPLLASVAVPVRIIWGEEDAWLDPALGERLRQEIPGSELELVAGAGHFVMEDAPEAIAAELSRFFGAA